jgi:hypothetical protein
VSITAIRATPMRPRSSLSNMSISLVFLSDPAVFGRRLADHSS